MCLPSQTVQYKQEVCGEASHLVLVFLDVAKHITQIHYLSLQPFILFLRREKCSNVYKWTQLTGILLGCCSRICLTSSTLCSVGRKRRFGLMETHKADEVLIKQQTKQTHTGQKRGDKHRDVLMGKWDCIQISNDKIKSSKKRPASVSAGRFIIVASLEKHSYKHPDVVTFLSGLQLNIMSFPKIHSWCKPKVPHGLADYHNEMLICSFSTHFISSVSEFAYMHQHLWVGDEGERDIIQVKRMYIHWMLAVQAAVFET